MKKRSSRRTPRLGQHFLTGTWAAVKLAGALGLKRGEAILEIGPGTGALTRELLKISANVVAVEKDPSLVVRLREMFAHELSSGALSLFESDIRDFDPSSNDALRSTPYTLAANIPYYITGEILRQFLETEKQPRALALLVQKEVAERIVAKNGKESILSLSVKAYGAPRIIPKVSRGNFSPPPSVDSAILLIDGVSKDFFSAVREVDFFKVVRAGFASKRKYLANNLSTLFGKDVVGAALLACGIGERARAEDVPLEKWKCLTQYLFPR